MFGAPFGHIILPSCISNPKMYRKVIDMSLNLPLNFILFYLNDDNYCSDAVVLFSYASFL